MSKLDISVLKEYNFELIRNGFYKRERDILTYIIVINELEIRKENYPLLRFSFGESFEKYLNDIIENKDIAEINFCYFIYLDKIREVMKMKEVEIPFKDLTVLDFLRQSGLEDRFPELAKEYGLKRLIESIGMKTVIEEFGLRAVIKEIGAEAVIKEIGAEAVIKEIGAQALIKEIGIKSVIKEIGVEAVIKEIGAEAVIKEIGAESVIKEIGVEALIKEIGVEALIKEIGVEALIKEIGVEAIVKEIGVNKLKRIIAKMEKSSKKSRTSKK